MDAAEEDAMNRDVLFIHHVHVNARVWSRWLPRFRGAGFRVHAPDWPGLEGEPCDLRVEEPETLAELGIPELVDAYDSEAMAFAEPPILVGLGYGALVAQLLLGRGAGAAAILVSSEPPTGVPGGSDRRGAPRALAAWDEPVCIAPEDFDRTVAAAVPERERAQLWDELVVPAPGRVLAQASWKPGLQQVAWARADRPPLLLMWGKRDRVVPAAVHAANAAMYTGPGVVEHRVFAEGGHLLPREPDWAAAADAAVAFLQRHLAR